MRLLFRISFPFNKKSIVLFKLENERGKAYFTRAHNFTFLVAMCNQSNLGENNPQGDLLFY